MALHDSDQTSIEDHSQSNQRLTNQSNIMNNFSFYKDRKALYCLIFIWLCLSFLSTFAANPKRHFYNILQQHHIDGTVTDGISPLPGVTIAVKNKSNNTVISDYSGQFSISTAPYDTLIVSFIGFKTVLIPIAGRKKVDIRSSMILPLFRKFVSIQAIIQLRIKSALEVLRKLKRRILKNSLSTIL